MPKSVFSGFEKIKLWIPLAPEIIISDSLGFLLLKNVLNLHLLTPTPLFSEIVVKVSIQLHLTVLFLTFSFIDTEFCLLH